MNVAQFLAAIIPLVPKLVAIAEAIHPQRKQGKKKLKKVLSTVETLAAQIPGVAADIKKIHAEVRPVIESAVNFMKHVQSGGPQ